MVENRARFSVISNHKRGFINSTVGNAIRGGLLGAALFAGAIALTLLTGGAAAPLLAPAFMAMFALPALNGGAGLLRWSAETAGGIVGINRKSRSRGNSGNASEGKGLGGMLMGLVGAAVALIPIVAQAKGLIDGFRGGNKTQKNQSQSGQSNGQGRGGQSQDAPAAGQQTGQRPGMRAQEAVNANQERAQEQARASGFGPLPTPPLVPESLASKQAYDPYGGVTFKITPQDMQDPKFREDLLRYSGDVQTFHQAALSHPMANATSYGEQMRNSMNERPRANPDGSMTVGNLNMFGHPATINALMNNTGQTPAPAQPQTAPAQPQTDPAQPQTAPAQPQTDPAQPQTAPAQPQAAPAQPQTAPAQPQTAPAKQLDTKGVVDRMNVDAEFGSLVKAGLSDVAKVTESLTKAGAELRGAVDAARSGSGKAGGAAQENRLG